MVSVGNFNDDGTYTVNQKSVGAFTLPDEVWEGFFQFLMRTTDPKKSSANGDYVTIFLEGE